MGMVRRRASIGPLKDRSKLDEFGQGCTLMRGVPVKRIRAADGSEVAVTTVYDLLMAQYGVLAGDDLAWYRGPGQDPQSDGSCSE